MSKLPETSVPIFELLAKRWSPRSFDESHQLSDAELLAILEAARWSPSQSNGQPWRFSVARRGDELHEKVVAALTGFNQAWAPAASALVVLSIKKGESGESDKRNFYDAGLAASMMSVQVQSMGLYTHQMIGVHFEELHASLGLPQDIEVGVVIAIGKLDKPEKFEGKAYEREIAPRTRLPLEEIVLHGKP